MISEIEYQRLIEELKEIWDISSKEEEFDRIANLVEEYEDLYYPIPKPSLYHVVKFKLENKLENFKWWLKQLKWSRG
jgi:hypothetical protein